MTGRQLVSDVRATFKLISSDTILTDRAILSEIRSNALLLIKRETNLRKLWATDTVFTTIPCVDMVEVPISECYEYVDNCTIARSKLPIPRISEGNYQYVIQGVYSINAMSGKGKKLKEITVNRYINLLKLPIVKQEEYFWVTNNYLYVTNPFVKAVRLVALFEEDVPNELLYGECGCGDSITDDEWCKNPLDKEFPLPGYLRKQVLDLTAEKLSKTYYAVKEDISNQGLNEQSPNVNPK